MNFIEHINIIDCFHQQIEALLDLMQCASSDCTDIKSVNVASEMCQTMMDELMAEIGQIENDWRKGKEVTEQVKTDMCDDYCRYTHSEKVECIENICAECPLNKLR